MMKTARPLTLVLSNLIIFSFLSLNSLNAFSFILPLDFIAKQTTSTTGRTVTSFDQEVIFTIDGQTAKTSEVWLVEGDKNLKLSAQGIGAIKENINLNYLYNSKTRTQIIGKQKNSVSQSADFFEKFLFIRSLNSFYEYLKELGIHEQVRLSRAEGLICLAIGKPSEGDKKYPQIWIDQDQFLIRKIRLPSGTEINLSNYVKLSDDFWLAKTKIIKWNNNTVKINVKSINTKTGAKIDKFYPQNLDMPSEMSFATNTSLNQLIQEFYLRFR